MKHLLVVFLSCTIQFSWAQSVTDNILTLEEAREASPDSVFALTLYKSKLTEFPVEILAYKNLRFLDVSKNKLTSIPLELNQLSSLKALNLGKNKLRTFPIALCSMTHLEELRLNENKINSIPECIKYFTELHTLDLFETNILSLPEELTLLKNLKSLDLRGMLYGPTFQASWKEALPSATIQFDSPCNCVEGN
jgi:Leucine-rich repeat (LRR) protein